MKIKLPTRLLPCLLLACWCGNGLHAQKPAAAPDFSIQTYRFPSSDLIGGFVSKERGKLRAPAMPAASASTAELDRFIRTSHSVVKDFLARLEMVLPTGSLVCFDPVSQTLVLRSTAAGHELMQPLAYEFVNQRPKHIAWTLDILETKAAAARAAMKSVLGQSDHRTAYEQLLPQSKTVATMRGETKAGQIATVSQAAHADDPAEYYLDEKQRVEPTFEGKVFGTQLELEPVVDPDGVYIDLNFRLTHQHASPVPRWEPLTGESAAEKIQARWMDTPLAEVVTSITMQTGTTRMLGAWALDGATDPALTGNVRVAFLRAAIVSLLPLTDDRLEQMVKSRGEAVEPAPKIAPPQADADLPLGMSVRWFRVPPDFLSMNDGKSEQPAPDPFANGVVANEPRFTPSVNAEEIFRAAGIPFPPGTSAKFVRATGELVVRNTPENLNFVSMLVQDEVSNSPNNVSFALYVVQGEAAFIRRLERESFLLADHSAAWKAVEDAAANGTAQILRSSWIESKSGQQCKTASVVEHARSTGLELSSGSQVSTSSQPADKATTVATASVKNGPDAGFLSVSRETSQVGLIFEIEPTVGPDSSLDISVAIDYDYAPPIQRQLDEPPPARTIQMAVPVTEYRKAQIKTATTMLSGSTRLLGVWKPSGTPELDGEVLQAVFLRADILRIVKEQPDRK